MPCRERGHPTLVESLLQLDFNCVTEAISVVWFTIDVVVEGNRPTVEATNPTML
jgi:hypothetical protein